MYRVQVAEVHVELIFKVLQLNWRLGKGLEVFYINFCYDQLLVNKVVLINKNHFSYTNDTKGENEDKHDSEEVGRGRRG